MTDGFVDGALKVLFGAVGLALAVLSVVRWKSFQAGVFRYLRTSGPARSGNYSPTEESAWWVSVALIMLWTVQGVVLVWAGVAQLI